VHQKKKKNKKLATGGACKILLLLSSLHCYWHFLLLFANCIITTITSRKNKQKTISKVFSQEEKTS